MSLPKIVTMSVEEWINVLDCPVQRNTERHALAALRRHLAKPAATHMSVAAARVAPTNRLYKLDGHTRAFLWANGSLEPVGDRVLVELYDVKDLAEVKELYYHFDNQAATESARDRFYGHLRENNITPKSSILSLGAMPEAFMLLTGVRTSDLDLRRLVGVVREALIAIDDAMFTKNKFMGPLIAVMIATIHQDPVNIEFWRKYFADEGSKTNGEMDGVQLLCELVAREKAAKAGRKTDRYKLAGSVLSCFNFYMAGKTSKRMPVPTDLAKYVNKVKIPRGQRALKIVDKL